MFKNGSSKFSVFENRYNKVFNYEINETLNQEKDKNFFYYTKNYNKTKDENYEIIRILDKNKNIVEYVSQNREPWKSEENSKRKNSPCQQVKFSGTGSRRKAVQLGSVGTTDITPFNITSSKTTVPYYLNKKLLDNEAAMVVTLEAGNYTARVYGKSGGTGIGRVGIDKIVDEWNVSQ